MAALEPLRTIKKGVDAWNEWRKKSRVEKPDLRNTNLSNLDLRGVDFSDTRLQRCKFDHTNLSGCNLNRASPRRSRTHKHKHGRDRP
jgi:uncharacterized protein YjbI with pentapeptide repeats